MVRFRAVVSATRRVVVLHQPTLDLARRQFGALSRRQLVDDLDWSRSQISRARTERTLIPILPSTYRVASHPDTFLLRAWATQLWAAGDGFLSSWTAGRIRGLRRMPGDRIHFTAPVRFGRRPPDWIHLDRTSWYGGDRDRETLSTGLVVATPMRMLFGLAADLLPFRFARAAEDAWHLGLVTPDDARAYLERHRCRGKDGVRVLEWWLERVADHGRPAQSGLEQEVIAALDRLGLPPVVRQHPLRLSNGETIHLDLAWPEIRLAVEPGASWFHGGDAGQARDHDRDLACNELGWVIIRLDESFRDDPIGAARRIARAHAARTSELARNPPKSA